MHWREQASLVQYGETESSGQMRLFRDTPKEEFILFFTQKRGMLNVNGRSYSLPAYSFLLLAYEESHFAAQHSMPLQWLHLYLAEETLRSIGIKTGKTYAVAQPIAVKEVWKILVSCESGNDSLRQMTQANAIALLLCLLRKETAVGAEKAVQVPHYDKLEALRREIYQNPAKDWYIQDICEQLCISRPYFHKIYLAAFGTTCTQDVIESRIAYAKEILAQTDDAVFDVSQKCGFETDVYFMRQFKRHTGMTPTAYRRICRQENQNAKKIKDADKK